MLGHGLGGASRDDLRSLGRDVPCGVLYVWFQRRQRHLVVGAVIRRELDWNLHDEDR
jgi:hypothetical protein